MNSSVSRLRKKYIVTASVIVFAVIFLMVAVLNILMKVSYKKEESLIENVVSQAAIQNINTPYTEKFDLKDAKKTSEGDFIIPRDVRDIQNITVYGKITNKKDAVWYSAGGGLMFEAYVNHKKKMVYKDYTFNKDTQKVTIDFSSYSKLKTGIESVSVKEKDITGEYFLVSKVWWQNSSNDPDGPDENINLSLESIELQYKDERHMAFSSNNLVSHITFADTFKNKTPEILNVTGCFYLITDKNNNLLSINDGNLTKPVANEEAAALLKKIGNKDSGKIKKDGSGYGFHVHETDGKKVIIFINDNFINGASLNLLLISTVTGVIVFILLLVIIIIVSGVVVKPIAESLEKQNQFVSNAGHELKTPLAVISASCDIISKTHGDDRWTKSIKTQTENMYRLITELLDLSRILEIKDESLSFKETNISMTVTNSLLYFESLFFEKGKTLTKDIEENVLITCNEEKIERLVGILVDNALKYSDERSEIKFSLKKEKNHAVIKCSNLCSDFCFSDGSKIFERFYRSDNDCTLEAEGFGLGLSIAKAIVDLHKGKIYVQHKENTVTFTVVI